MLADSHVTQFWDPGQVTGHWFGDHLGGGGLAWDVYYLYGPSAQWDSPPLSAGGSVIGTRDQLWAALQQTQL